MYKVFFKRFIDIIVSLSLILILSPLMVVVSIIVLIGMGFPIIFTQERVGRNEKTFKMYKFRTMTNVKDEKGNLLSEDLRLTKVGAFLRSTSIDELPELFNILIGQMSFIGPRPLPTYYMPYYYENERKRHAVRGGLVPPDVLSGKAVTTWEEQLKYEINYAENLSLLLDTKIALGTLRILLSRVKGNYGSEFRLHLNEYRREEREVEL